MQKKKSLLDEYRFPGFSPRAKIHGVFGDSKARIIFLHRRQKKRFVVLAELLVRAFTIGGFVRFEIFLAGRPAFIWSSRFVGSFVGGAGR